MQEGMDRRGFIKAVGVGTVAAAVGGGAACSSTGLHTGTALGALGQVKDGRYVLPPLPYDYGALEPFLGSQTLHLHHDAHHQGYVNGLNAALDGLARARAGGDHGDAKSLTRALAYNGSGHVLHTIFWRSMTPGGSPLEGPLAQAVERDFGSPEAFQAQFAAATKKVEASGWGVVGYEPMAGRVLVLQAEKHQNLTMWGVLPLLVCDVWEHAYYLDYQNRRGEYVDGFMGVADWGAANSRYMKAIA